MKALGVNLVIPSYHGNVEGILSVLKTQSIPHWDYVIKSHISPAARARNLGAQEAIGEYLIFIDDDVKFSSPNLLENVLKALKSLGPKDVINITWRLRPDANWIQRKQAGDARFTFMRSAHLVEIPWMECGAACFAMRSDWFAQLGGYDETLISAEDCDLSYRILKGGGKIFTLPHYWIEHDPPKTFRGAAAKVFWYERGNAQLARKYPEANYRINLNRPWKAVTYLLLRSLALFPLMFINIAYHHRRPTLTWRPVETWLSYLGAWAYVREWLFPTKAINPAPTQALRKRETTEVCV